ncbi:MAG: conjugal transfer protein TraD [Alphaproteobacteria bacterium]|nr:conjugal transfer protein TraD [Alphaproteobacteria bacterium]
MISISHQKERLDRQKARLQSQEQKLKTLERKQRTRRLIELGALFVKAELEELNNNTLLGALLSLKHHMASNEAILSEWTEQGAKAFEALDQNQSAGADKIPLVITFQSEPPRELKSHLRDLNFKWNPFRKEWYGYGNTHELQSLIKSENGTIEACDGS